ncbi:ribonuclease M5 [Clostridia bacterium]|nr:ribonuclease M5 [Clostridia bacterium]
MDLDMEKIKLRQAVIVEGKYDRIKLENIIDAVIIPTNGFAVFRDKEIMALIRLYASTTGIIIMTDSDSAGEMIRSKIKGAVKACNITNVYVKPLPGKERRKTVPSAEGFLGVEGVPKEEIVAALRRAGVLPSDTSGNIKGAETPVTKADLMTAGLIGTAGAASRRKIFLKKCGLPENISTNSLLQAANVLMTREEFLQYCDSASEAPGASGKQEN